MLHTAKPSLYIEDVPRSLADASKPAKKGSAIVPCKLCGVKVKISTMREHVGKHIILAARDEEEPGLKEEVTPDVTVL
jgi:hypothetical protein